MAPKPKVPGLARRRGYNHLAMPPKSFTVCKHMLTIKTAQKTHQEDSCRQSLAGGGGGGVSGGQFQVFFGWGLTLFLPPPPPPPLALPHFYIH